MPLENKNDERLEQLLEKISRLISTDQKTSIVPSEKDDKIDLLGKAIDELQKQVEDKERKINKNKERLETITDILLEYVVLNFARRVTLSENADEIDAIAAGLNAIGEELAHSLSSQKKYATDLEEANKLLTEGNDKIKAVTEDLKRSNVELEQFAYVASHDLQEPLRMITSYVQLLEKHYKDKLDSDANDFINFAVDGASRMQTLISSLLEYSRINRLKAFELIDLDDTLHEVLRDLAVSIKETNANISWNALPNIFGDSVLIGQLFFNLIANALKFRSKAPPEITISCKKQNQYYLFSVKDNGIGLKKEYAEKIFVIFQRLHSKDKYPGTGIGLAICKKIVERHGGTIWVESEPNKGSTFYFTIKADKGNTLLINDK